MVIKSVVVSPQRQVEGATGQSTLPVNTPQRLGECAQKEE